MSETLALDASTAVGEALRQRGIRLFMDPRLELFISEAAWEETRHEIERRVGIIAERQSLLNAEREALLQGALALLAANVQVIPNEAYGHLAATARACIPADPSDWPTVALGLVLDGGVWTEDRDFFGCGLATWSTAVLDHHLTEGDV